MTMSEFIDSQPVATRDVLHKIFVGFPERAQVDYYEILPDSIILRQGYPAINIFVLLEGHTVLTGLQPYGYNYVLSYFNAIHFFGEFEAIGKYDTYIATIIAKSNCRLLRFSADVYNAWLRSNTDIILDRTSGIVAMLVDQLLCERSNLFLDAGGRLITYLLDYYNQNVTAKSSTVRIKAIRNEISDATGYSIRTVNRQIAKLCEKGVLTNHKRGLYISKEQYELLKTCLPDYLS